MYKYLKYKKLFLFYNFINDYHINIFRKPYQNELESPRACMLIGINVYFQNTIFDSFNNYKTIQKSILKKIFNESDFLSIKNTSKIRINDMTFKKSYLIPKGSYR